MIKNSKTLFFIVSPYHSSYFVVHHISISEEKRITEIRVLIIVIANCHYSCHVGNYVLEGALERSTSVAFLNIL